MCVQHGHKRVRNRLSQAGFSETSKDGRLSFLGFGFSFPRLRLRRVSRSLKCSFPSPILRTRELETVVTVLAQSSSGQETSCSHCRPEFCFSLPSCSLENLGLTRRTLEPRLRRRQRRRPETFADFFLQIFVSVSAETSGDGDESLRLRLREP
jgi:hypothetical protein